MGKKEDEMRDRARILKARLTKEGRELMPIREIRDTTSNEKRSWREVKGKLGLG